MLGSEIQVHVSEVQVMCWGLADASVCVGVWDSGHVSGSGMQIMCWGLRFRCMCWGLGFQVSGVPAHVSLYVGLGYVCGPGILGVCIQAPGGMF